LIIDLLSFFVVTLAALIAWSAKFQSERSANAAHEMAISETTPFLRVVPVNGEQLRLDNGVVKTLSNGQLIGRPVLMEIENVGRGPAFVTSIYRSWAWTPDTGYPPPIPSTATDKLVRIWMPVGPASRSFPLDSRLADFGDLPMRGEGWLMFYGFVHFQDIQKRSYVSGFAHILRTNFQDRGLHFAAVEDSRYNYHEEIRSEVGPHGWKRALLLP
jgi:hypothetical protein